MSPLHSNEQLTDCLSCQLSVFALGQSGHGALNEIELLLEVVEADSSINLIPISNLLFKGKSWVWAILVAFKAAVNLLIIEDVEQFLEQEAATEVLSQIFNLPASSHGENSVQKDSEIMSLLNQRSSLSDGRVHVGVSDVSDITTLCLLLVNLVLPLFAVRSLLIFFLFLLMDLVGIFFLGVIDVFLHHVVILLAAIEVNWL